MIYRKAIQDKLKIEGFLWHSDLIYKRGNGRLAGCQSMVGRLASSVKVYDHGGSTAGGASAGRGRRPETVDIGSLGEPG